MGAREKAKEISEKFNAGRGAIRLSILGMLSHGEQNGYRIAKAMKEADESLDVPYGVLYPMLERMERDGLIKGHWEKGQGQKGVHMYELTREGRKALKSSHTAWLRIMKSVRSLVEAGA